MPMNEENAHEFQFTKNPICPFCEHEQKDWWEWLDVADFETTSTECGDCGEEFKFTTYITTRFETELPEK